jgi:hypothetical protein
VVTGMGAGVGITVGAAALAPLLMVMLPAHTHNTHTRGRRHDSTAAATTHQTSATCVPGVAARFTALLVGPCVNHSCVPLPQGAEQAVRPVCGHLDRGPG